MEIEGETEIDCICPKCRHKFSIVAHYTAEIEPSDWNDLD
jgi:hypothetical protein